MLIGDESRQKIISNMANKHATKTARAKKVQKKDTEGEGDEYNGHGSNLHMEEEGGFSSDASEAPDAAAATQATHANSEAAEPDRSGSPAPADALEPRKSGSSRPSSSSSSSSSGF